VQLYLDDLDPEEVRVELYANGQNGAAPQCVEMQRTRPLLGATNAYAYRAEVSADRAAEDYTVRLMPHHAGVAIPLEDARILWQR
jgi:starch phosphorylase